MSRRVRLPVWATLVVLIAFHRGGVGGSLLHAAPAGQVISNQADALYVSPTGATSGTQSNPSSLTVVAVASLQATPDDAVVTSFPAPQAGIDRLFTITNQANRDDRFRLSAAAVTPPATLTGLFFDLNGNGVVDGTDAPITVGVTSSPPVPQGGSLGVLLRYSAAGLASGTPVTLTLTAESLEPGAVNGPASDDGTIRDQVTGGPVFSDPANPGQSPAKTADGQARLNVVAGQVVTFALDFANSGTADATNAVVTDTLVPGLAYLPGSLALDGAALTDGADGDAGEIAGATVTVRLAAVAPGAVHRVTFQAQVGSGLANGTLLDNVASFVADGVAPAPSSRAVLLVDPFGTVFEASTGSSIAGAALSLLTGPPPGPLLPLIPAGGAGAPPNIDNLNPFVSDPAGRYSFLLDAAQIGAPGAAATYYLHAVRANFLSRVVRIDVEPSPASTVAAPLYTVTLSALDTLPLAPPGTMSLVPGPVVIPDVGAVGFNLPMFPDTPLTLIKTADRSHAMLGESIGYRVEVFNGGAAAVLGLTLDDQLPQFVDLVEGVSRVTFAGATTPIEPAQAGRTVTFPLGDLPAGEGIVVSYRARIAPGAPAGPVANLATVSGTLPTGDPTGAGPVQAVVLVRLGIFSFQQVLIGRVFEDVDGDREFGAGDPPLPGVRLVLDNGMSVTSDSEGLYSLPSVPEGARMIALDRTTYPPGYCPPEPERLSDTGPSRLLRTPLRGGALLKQNFILARDPSCPTQPVEMSLPGEAAGAGAQGPDAPAATGPFKGRAVPVEAPGPGRSAPAGTAEGGARPAGDSVDEAAAGADEEMLPPGTYVSRQTEVIPPVQPGRLLLLEPQEGAVAMQGGIRVVARTHRDGTVGVAVNDHSVRTDRIGRTVLDDRNRIATFTFVGVPVEPGPNRLTVWAMGDDARHGTRTDLTVYGRGPVTALRMAFDRDAIVADGRDGTTVRVELFDAWGNPAQDTRIRITSSAGQLQATGDPSASIDRVVASRDGFATVTLTSDRSTGPVALRAEYGDLSAAGSVLFEPLPRPDLLVGIADLTLGAGSSDPGVGADPATVEDGARGRVAFFYKGTVAQGAVLTTAYDSDGPLNRTADGDRLYTLDPLQEIYPVMGDSSVRFQEAVSNSRAYLKLEKARSYLLYGDFDPGMADTQLAENNRNLTGLKLNLENDSDDLLRLTVASSNTAFAREVIPASGIGGVYRLAHDNVLPGSERITLEVHDRRNPEAILGSEALVRGTDYDFDPLNGTLLFKHALNQFDPQFNLVEIVVLYEYQTTGFEGLAWSGRGRKTWGDGASGLGFSTIGGSEDGGDDYRLLATDLNQEIPGAGLLSVEMARSEGRPLNRGTASLGGGADESGAAYRLLYEQEIAAARGPLRLLYSEVDAEFLNPFGATVTPGNRTIAAGFEPRLSERLRLGVRVKDETNDTPNVDNSRTTASVELQGKVNEQIGVIGGYDHRDFQDSVSNSSIQSDLLSLGFDYRPAPRWNLALRREQNLTGASDPSFPDSTFLNAGFRASEQLRYFLNLRDSDGAIESIADVSASGVRPPRSSREVRIGAETRLGTHSTFSSRYQIENGMLGADAYAVIGLGTRLPVNDTFALDFTGEAGLHVAGQGQSFKSLSSGFTWFPREALKTTFRYEILDADGTGQTVTAGALGKPNDDVTLLARLTASDASQFGRGTTEVRFLGGLAVRPLRRDDFGLLFTWERNDRRQSGAGDLDRVRTRTDTLSTDGVIDLTPTLRFFGKVALSFVSDGPADLPTVSTTVSLGQTRLEYRFARRWDVAGEIRDLRLWQDDLHRDSLGTELGFWATQDLRLGFGYGYTASQPIEGHESAVRDGFYLNLTTKVHRILQLFGREP
jgi:uncharacterized repeat protein (TIGR01451 family)